MRNLPDSWNLIELAKLGNWYGGATPSKGESRFWENGTIPWISPKDMGPDVLLGTQDKISSSALDESPVRLVPEGSVALVVRSGILQRTLPVAIVPFAAALNQDMKAIVPRAGVDKRWIAWGLRTFEREILREVRKSGTTVASLEVPRLMSFKLPVPSLPDQHRSIEAIEAAFARIDGSMAGVKSADSKQGQLHEALLARAVSGKLVDRPSGGVTDFLSEVHIRRNKLATRNQKFKRPVTLSYYILPNYWEMASLSEISYGWGYGTSTKCSYSASGAPVLRIPNVVNGAVDSANDIKFSVDSTLDLSGLFLDQGDLLFVRTNGSPDLIGRVGIVRESIEAAFASYLIRFRLVPGGVLPDWVRIVLNSPIWRQYIVSSASSSAGQHNINSDFLSSLPIPIPPIEEQQEIVLKLEQWQARLSVLESAIRLVESRAAELKESVLSRAFAGKLV
jgi:type I restriction enzyme S subunit